MKFSTTSKTFTALLSSAIMHSTKNIASIGGFFLLDAREGRLTVKATCVGSDFRGSIPVNVEEEGSVCVIADKLHAFMSQIVQMGDVEMKIATTDKNMMSITSNQTMPKAKILLRTRDAGTFPEQATCPEKKWTEIESGMFATALRHVAVLADKENSNCVEIRKSVHIEQHVKSNEETGAEETVLTFVATNGKGLATESFVISAPVPEFTSANIPQGSMPRIISMIEGNEAETVSFAVDNGKAFFRSGDAEISVTLYSDNYCAWERVIPCDRPEAPLRWIELDEKEFSRTVVMAGITAPAESGKITVRFENDGVTVSSINKDNDYTEQKMDLKIEGNPLSINYDKNLLLPCLKGLEGAKEPGEVAMKLGFSPASPAALIRRVDGKGPLYVIMPIIG